MEIFKIINLRVGIVLILLILSNVNLRAQDIHFSQYYMNPLQQNPAMAGAAYGLEATVIYKDQWRAIGAPYKTFAAAYDMSFENRKSKRGFMSGGINLFSDKAGDSNMGTTQASLSVAYISKLNRFNKLGGGIQLGFFQRSIDFTNLQWGSQYDGMAYNSILSNGESSFGTSALSRFDLGAGLSWIYNNTSGDIKVTDNHDLNFKAGIAVMHLTRPDVSFNAGGDLLPMKLVAHANGVISFEKTKMAIVPGFMYTRQGKHQEIYIGTLIRYLITQDSKYTGLKQASAFYFGAYVRMKDAITTKVIYEYAGWGIGLSYDINTSSLKVGTATRGGLEIALRYTGASPYSKRSGAFHSRY